MRAFVIIGCLTLGLSPHRLQAADSVRIYVDDGRTRTMGSGFITQDPRLAGDADYVLVTALHVMRQRGFTGRNVTVQTATDQGTSAYLSSVEYHAWPGFDLAAIPIQASQVEALGARPLALVGSIPPQLIHEFAALAVPERTALSGAVEGVVAAHKWKEGIENAGGSGSTLAAFASHADLLIYGASTSTGMSGAPLVYDGQVVAVHLQGVADGAKYRNFAVAVLLLPSQLGRRTPSREILESELIAPGLNQSAAAGLPPDVRERLLLTQGIVSWDGHPRVTSGLHLYSGVMIGTGPEIFRSSNTALMLDAIVSGGLPERASARGVGLGGVLGLGYARIRRDLGDGPEGKNAFWSRFAFGPAFFWLNPEALSSVTVGIYPVLDLFGLRRAQFFDLDERAEMAVAVGGLLDFRVASLTTHLALVGHAAFTGHQRKLQLQGASGWDFGFEAGLGIGAVWTTGEDQAE